LPPKRVINQKKILIAKEGFEHLEITNAESLWSWLKAKHAQEESIWLITYKKAEGSKYVSREEFLDALIAYGWTDGRRKKLDSQKTMQLISPRRVEHWAQSYKSRAAKLIEEGRMAEPGLRSIASSKAKGLWDFMNDVDALIIPPDLKKVLESKSGALAFFTAVNDSSKRNMLRHIKLAKTNKTRNNRIEQIANLAAKGQKLPGS